jgi:hypothetical protein
MPRFDWYFDRVVDFERPDTLAVDYDVVRATPDLRSDRFMGQLESCRRLQSPFRASRSAVAERTVVDLAWALRPTSSANTALPSGAGRQKPAEQVQVKDQRGNEYQAPPTSLGAEHNNDDGDPNCQQQPDHQR